MTPHIFLFYLLVFFLPSALSYHVFPSWAHIFGVRVDYLAPTLYFTDILIFLLIISWLPHAKFRLPSKKLILFSLSFAVFIVLNILVSEVREVSIFRWLKAGELALLASFVKANARKIKKRLSLPLGLALIYSLAIGLLQFFLGKTTGLFYWIGERSFNLNAPGIALVSLRGVNFLRPYATFPHPNALAGFSLAATSLVGPLGKLAGYALTFISFSQGAWISALLRFFIKRSTPWLIVTALVSLSLLTPFAARTDFLQSLSSSQNYVERLLLSEKAAKLLSKSPIVGVGLGNFIPSSDLPILQPVHNIFLLVAAETGLVGLLLFSFLLLRLLKTREIGLSLSLLAILLTGFFDHYWITLQSPQLLFAIVIGFALRQNKPA